MHDRSAIDLNHHPVSQETVDQTIAGVGGLFHCHLRTTVGNLHEWLSVDHFDKEG
jgi:hypothetical protein